MNRNRNNHRSAGHDSWLLDLSYAVLRIARWMMGNQLQLKPVPVVARKGRPVGVTRDRVFPDSFGDLRVPLSASGRPRHVTEMRIPRQGSQSETPGEEPG